MGHALTGDQLRIAFKKLSELARQFGQAEYPYDPNRAIAVLQRVIEGRFGLFPSELHAADIIPEGYTVLEDVEPIPDLQVEDMEFFSFLFLKLKEREGYVNGKAMRDRARVEKANLGLVDGKRILADQSKIPAGVNLIVLTGTLLRDPAGDLYVACLYRGGDQWHLSFDKVDVDWFGGRLARRKSRT